MLDVVEILQVMDKGVTEPIKCRLSDGTIVVAKYPNNRCGSLVLLNEYIGNTISEDIGLTVPSFGICNLTEEVVFLNEASEDIGAKNCGLCFYSEFISSTVPKIVWNKANNKEIEKLILVDHLLNNFDRYEGNLLFDVNKGTVYAIDYSHIFSNGDRPNLREDFFIKGKKEGEFLYSDILIKNAIYDEIIGKIGFNEETLRKVAKRINGVITSDYVSNLIKNDIPTEWRNVISEDEEVAIKDFIVFRAEHIEEICEMIIEDRRRSV